MSLALFGMAYRKTFIFDKGNLTDVLDKELRNYITNIQKEEENINQDGCTSGFNIHAYDDTVLIEEDEETRVTPAFIVVLYGLDWLNFTENLLQFHETFPPGKIPREFIYSYILRDEKRSIDDFI